MWSPGEELEDMAERTGWRTVLEVPELNMAMFAFLLHFAWEILQSGFFHGMEAARHGDAVRVCTQATFGDVGITLVAFWVMAWRGGGRHWPLRPRAGQIAGFTAAGLAVTIVLELLATQVWYRWSYSQALPIIPLLEVGLIPLMQWSVLPPLLVWFVHRQLT